MNTRKYIHHVAFGVALVTILGAKCPSIPEIQSRVVQLVKTQSSVVGPFEARGNDVADDGFVDLVAEYDIKGALDAAGVDVSDVVSVAVRSVEVRVSMPDPDPARTIAGGSVAATRVAAAPRGGCGIGGSATLVSSWTGVVNNFQSFTVLDVEQPGVDFLNCLLAEYLAALQAGGNPTSMVVRYDVDGVTTPASDANFDWEVKLNVDIVGEVKVDVIG